MRIFSRLLLFVVLFLNASCLFSKEKSDRSVLFIMHKLRLGGSEQAFLSLINGWTIPHTKVDIFITKRGGILESRLREDFPLVDEKKAFHKQYDAAICFVEWLDPRDYLWNICAKKKVQWIHTDLLFKPEDRPFKHAKLCYGIDAFVCVSDKAAESAKIIQPQLKENIFTIHNVLDGDVIKRKSKETSGCFPQDGICNVLSVGRLASEKAFDRAITVHSRLNKEGINFRWYIVGEGREREKLELAIKENGLEGKFILLGQKTNPYPYFAQADIFALPSLYEGCSIVINEAKILGCPILFTEVSGAREQIESGINGLIVNNTEEAIYLGLKKLLQDEALRRSFSQALQGFVPDNASVYQQIEELLFAE